MQEMVNAVLGYAKVDTRGRDFEVVDLNAVVDAVIDELREPIETTDARVTRDELPAVVADGSQIHQLLQNLLANALKFVSDRPPRVHVAAVDRDTGWEVSVRDNGIGIEPAVAERIFVMFQRLHTHDEYPGTGIGLAICKRIVERHGGRIWVESQPHRGSKFVFTLPKRSGGEDDGSD